MVVDAVKAIKMTTVDGKTKYPIANINIVIIMIHSEIKNEFILIDFYKHMMKINQFTIFYKTWFLYDIIL